MTINIGVLRAGGLPVVENQKKAHQLQTKILLDEKIDVSKLKKKVVNFRKFYCYINFTSTEVSSNFPDS